MLLDIEPLGAKSAVDPKRRQIPIHLGLVTTTAGQAREGAAQNLAAVYVKVAQKMTKTQNIADPSAFLGVRPDKNDGGSHLRPRPKDRWRQLPHQAHRSQTLNQHGQSAVVLAARPSEETLRDLPLHRHHHELES